MKSDLQCLVCLLTQGLNTAKAVTDDIRQHREILNRVSELLKRVDLKDSPAAISFPVYRIVSDVTGISDPYLELKRQSNEEALRLLPRLERILQKSNEPLKMALRMAVAGNIIDLGIGHKFDLKTDLQKILKMPFKIDASAELEAELISNKKLLYLGDNAGEIVFDRILIKALLKKGVDVTFVVKSSAIINDALMEDAEFVGMTSLVKVIETGSNDIGVNLNKTSTEFKAALASADIILAKGHGNFETCNDLPYNFYFLLKAKCPVVAKQLGIVEGDIVLKHIHNC